MLPTHRKTNPTATGIATQSIPGNLISVRAACAAGREKNYGQDTIFPNDSDINTKAAARQIVTASPGATTNHIQRDGRLLFSYIDMMTHNPTPPETLTRSRCLQLLFTGHRKLYGMKKEGLRFYNSPPGTDFTGRTCCAVFQEKK